MLQKTTRIALAVCLAWTPATADFASDHEALEQELVTSLVEYAAWCEGVELDAERQRVLLQVIELEPEHEQAREALGHKRKRDGTWRVPSKPGRVEDDEQALGELSGRRIRAVAGYRNGLLALLESEPVDDALREALFERILTLSPDDPEIHAQRGEERYGNAWVLAETARAYDRRPEIRRVVARAIREAGLPGVLASTQAEQRLGLLWTAHARTPNVEVFGTGTLEEAMRAAQATHAAADVFRKLFQCRTTHTNDFTVYLLANDDEKQVFLDELPDLTDDERAFLEQLIGSGIPRTGDVANWDYLEVQRLDGTVRHTLGGLLRDEFGITTDHAWAWEGIGLYLTRELVGSRLTWYIAPSDSTDGQNAELRTELIVSTANWIDAAYQLLRAGRAPDLVDVMSRDTNTMGVDEMLTAYALSAYLLEGRPRALVELLFRTGRGQTPEEAVPAALGIELDELGEHLLRWLSERRRPEYYGA